jgi:hypothetical protein
MARAITEIVEDELPHLGAGNLRVSRVGGPRAAVVDVVASSGSA